MCEICLNSVPVHLLLAALLSNLVDCPASHTIANSGSNTNKSKGAKGYGTQCEVDSCANANLSIMQKVKTDKSCNMCHTTRHLTIHGGGKSNEIGVFQTRTNLEDIVRLDTALKIAL